MKQPTLREIAEFSGVNVATVSRALANNPRISKATRDLVISRATAMGWKPNPFASAYMSHLRSTRDPGYRASLAWVCAEAYPKGELPGYHKLALKGATERAAALGFSLDPVWLGDFSGDGKRLTQILKSRGIPGVIFHGIDTFPGDLKSFEWNSFSVALWSAQLTQPMIHCAASNHYLNVPLAIQEIRRLGYRRIAMILSEDQDRKSHHAYFSAFYYAEKHPEPNEWIRSHHLTSGWNTPEMRENVRQWLVAHQPEVVIGEYVVWETLMEMKLRVPEDIAFVSLYWDPEWAHIGGIDQRPELIGANAVDLVSTLLTQNERGIPADAKYLLNVGRWVDGPSIPPRLNALPAGRIRPAAKKRTAKK